MYQFAFGSLRSIQHFRFMEGLTSLSPKQLQISFICSMRPNPSLNTDIPRAGLRGRSGPPVTLFR